MVIATHAILPILAVLENGGRMSLEKLAIDLIKRDSSRFGRDIKGIIENNINCLKIDGDDAVYDKTAKSYTKHWSLIERSAQQLFHNAIPNMKEFQLYPYTTRKNSLYCNLGIPWENIPEENHPEGLEWFGDQQNCNFREQGKKHCGFSCGIDQNVAIGNIYALFDDFSDIMKLQQAIQNRK